MCISDAQMYVSTWSLARAGGQSQSSVPSTVKHLAYPMVLTGAWEAQVMTEEQMKQLHEGLRRMGKQFVLDTLVDINVRHNCGFRILFFSYQWLLPFCRFAPNPFFASCFPAMRPAAAGGIAESASLLVDLLSMGYLFM